MEYRDIYTKDDEFTGIVREKHATRVAGEYYRHAIVILRNREGLYVLQQRSPKARYFAGKWDVTGGGVRHGETPEETAVREVKEELGLTIDINELVYLYKYRVEFEMKDGSIVYVFAASCDTSAGCNYDPYEVNDVKIVPFEEYFEAVMFNKDERFAQALREYERANRLPCSENESSAAIAYYHLPGLFEFYDFYRAFLPLYRAHRDWFYDWCEIGSIYGAPADCIFGGGRVGYGDDDPREVLQLMREYGISVRLTFSNSLLREEHLSDKRCNKLLEMLEKLSTEDTGCELTGGTKGSLHSPQNGVILHSDLLLHYINENYPNLYAVSSTTKVLTKTEDCRTELERPEFSYVVPDFRLNKCMDFWETLPAELKQKVEFLVNECCYFGCADRKACYENVSRKNLGEDCPDHICSAPGGQEGYRFSKAMKNPGFISIEDIRSTYLPMGFSHFKIEGRSLGSAMILEFLLYYMTKPEHQLEVREELYLDSMLDLF